MAVEELYKVELRGADIVALALARMDAEAKKSAQSFATHAGPSQQAASSFSQKVGGLADAFKMVSRDIGTVGGAGVQAFTHMADEALSIASVMTGGIGITAAIAAVGVAVGGLRALWVAEEEAMKRATEEKRAVLESQKNIIKSLAASIQEENRNATEEDAARIRSEIEATDRLIAVKRANLTVTSSLRANRGEALDDIKSRSELVRTERERVSALEAENAARTDLLAGVEKELETRGAMERRRVSMEKALAQETTAMKQAAQVSIAWANGIRAAWENLQVAKVEVRDNDMSELDRNAGAPDPIELQMEKERIERAEELKMRVDDLIAAQLGYRNVVATTASTTMGALEEEERQRRELVTAIQAQDRANLEYAAGMIYAASVNTAYTASMYAVGKGIDYASMELMRFQDINRDNYRDLLQINENTMAAWAQRLQAFLFVTAMEAGRMALMENAMGMGEVARGTGALFTNPAEAATHFVSAGMHYATSAAYATFAGGAAVGFGVVAASRGQGGMFASAAQDKEDLGGNRSSNGSVGGGPSGGMYGGGGERGSGQRPNISIIINNEPGSYSQAKLDEAAVEVSRHVARANRSWFERQRMAN